MAELERDGHVDAAHNARVLLATFEQAQGSHVTDRDQLRAELAALGFSDKDRPMKTPGNGLKSSLEEASDPSSS